MKKKTVKNLCLAAIATVTFAGTFSVNAYAAQTRDHSQLGVLAPVDRIGYLSYHQSGTVQEINMLTTGTFLNNGITPSSFEVLDKSCLLYTSRCV